MELDNLKSILFENATVKLIKNFYKIYNDDIIDKYIYMDYSRLKDKEDFYILYQQQCTCCIDKYSNEYFDLLKDEIQKNFINIYPNSTKSLINKNNSEDTDLYKFIISTNGDPNSHLDEYKINWFISIIDNEEEIDSELEGIGCGGHWNKLILLHYKNKKFNNVSSKYLRSIGKLNDLEFFGL